MVAGSNPAAATKVGILAETLEDIPLREVLGLLLGEEGKRRLRLRYLNNDKLFELYDAELLCRHRSHKGLYEDRRILKHFMEFLGGYPPTPELGKHFLSRFANRKPATLARYVTTLNGFFSWYGEPLDMKVRVPRVLPDYVQDADIDKLIDAIRNKQTHKRTVRRDLLLVDVAIHTGLRRGELAGLRVADVDAERQLLIVRDEAKGGRHRTVPLTFALAQRLGDHIKGMSKDGKIFGLAPSSISGKIAVFSRKAGIDLHTHSLRDHFGTTLLERGATIREVQELLGHSSLNPTERYTLLTGKHLQKAISLLDDDDHRQTQPERVPVPWHEPMSWEQPQYASEADKARRRMGMTGI